MSEWPQHPSDHRDPSSEPDESAADSTTRPVTDEPSAVAAAAETEPGSVDDPIADVPERDATVGPASTEVADEELGDEGLSSSEPHDPDRDASLPGMAELDELAAQLDAIDATLVRLDQDGEAVARQD